MSVCYRRRCDHPMLGLHRRQPGRLHRPPRRAVATGLIADMTISVLPILLGDGIPLFGGTARDQRLELSESRAFATGLVQLRYRLST